jgi:methylglyoxal synthase
VRVKSVLPMGKKQKIALVAHDHRKQDLLEWAKFNREALANRELFGTGGTGKMMQDELDLTINRLLSGPLGGDQQLGSRISEGAIDVLIFFGDPLMPQPHDPDVKALLRLAVLYNLPTASNRPTADFLISSPLFEQPCDCIQADYAARLAR